MFHKFSFLKWVFSKAVKKTLLAEFENDNIVRLLDILWNLHEDISESSAKDESRSVGLLLSSARKSIALYRAFLEMGISDETAKIYIEKIGLMIHYGDFYLPSPLKEFRSSLMQM